MTVSVAVNCFEELANLDLLYRMKNAFCAQSTLLREAGAVKIEQGVALLKMCLCQRICKVTQKTKHPSKHPQINMHLRVLGNKVCPVQEILYKLCVVFTVVNGKLK